MEVGAVNTASISQAVKFVDEIAVEVGCGCENWKSHWFEMLHETTEGVEAVFWTWLET